MQLELFKEICLYLKGIIANTEYEGHCFCVGGCIRDELLRNNIKDIDLVIDLPDGGIEFAKWLFDKGMLGGYPVVYPTYGTAMFRLAKFPKTELEVVQTRKEQYKDKNSRNPETAYGTLIEDAMRRDLTINAIYYDISKNKLIDPVNGVNDIFECVIRTPSSPDIVFCDDALRQLRCVRFATRYLWKISKETEDGIIRNAYRIKTITQERITDEIAKTLVGTIKPSEALRYWIKFGLLEYILPKLNKCLTNSKTLSMVCSHLDRLYKDKIEIMLAVLFQFESSELDSMKLSNASLEEIKFYIKSKELIMDAELSASGVRKFSHKYGRFLSDMIEYLSQSTEDEISNRTQLLRQIVAELRNDNSLFNEETKLPLTGNDIMEHFNLKPSPEVKRMLDLAWHYYYENPKYNKEDLLKLIENV